MPEEFSSLFESEITPKQQTNVPTASTFESLFEAEVPNVLPVDDLQGEPPPSALNPTPEDSESYLTKRANQTDMIMFKEGIRGVLQTWQSALGFGKSVVGGMDNPSRLRGPVQGTIEESVAKLTGEPSFGDKIDAAFQSWAPKLSRGVNWTQDKIDSVRSVLQKGIDSELLKTPGLDEATFRERPVDVSVASVSRSLPMFMFAIGSNIVAPGSGLSAMGVVEGGSMANTLEEKDKQNKLTENQEYYLSTLYGAFAAGTEKIPFDIFKEKIVGKGGIAALGRILTSQGAEGIQELGTQLSSNLIVHYGADKGQDLWEGLAESFFVGAALGTIGGLTTPSDSNEALFTGESYDDEYLPMVDIIKTEIKKARPEITDEVIEGNMRLAWTVYNATNEGESFSDFINTRFAGFKDEKQYQEDQEKGRLFMNQPAAELMGVPPANPIPLGPAVGRVVTRDLGIEGAENIDLAKITVAEALEIFPIVERVAAFGSTEDGQNARNILRTFGIWDENTNDIKLNWDKKFVDPLRDKLLARTSVLKQILESGDKPVVTDETGKPLLVFHGKKAVFSWDEEQASKLAPRDEQTAGGAIFFAGSPNLANTFASGGGRANRLIPAFLKGKFFDFRNPAQMGSLFRRLAAQGVDEDTRAHYIDTIKEGKWREIESGDVQAALKYLGYDGFLTKEGTSINYGVYDEANIVYPFDPLRRSKALFQGESEEKLSEYEFQDFLKEVRKGIPAESLIGMLPKFTLPELSDFLNRLGNSDFSLSRLRIIANSMPEYAKMIRERIANYPPEIQALPENIQFQFAILGQSPSSIIERIMGAAYNRLNSKDAHKILMELGARYSRVPFNENGAGPTHQLSLDINAAWEAIHPDSPWLSDILHTDGPVAAWIMNNLEDPIWKSSTEADRGSLLVNRVDEITPQDLTQGIKTNIRTAFRNAEARNLLAAKQAKEKKAKVFSDPTPYPDPGLPTLPSGMKRIETASEQDEIGGRLEHCYSPSPKNGAFYDTAVKYVERQRSGESVLINVKTKDGESTIELRKETNYLVRTPEGKLYHTNNLQDAQEKVRKYNGTLEDSHLKDVFHLVQHTAKYNSAPPAANKKLAQDLMQKLAMKDAQTLFQQASSRGGDTKSNRGAVTFLEDGRAMIYLFEGADASTLFHESWHVFTRHANQKQMEQLAAWTKTPVKLLQAYKDRTPLSTVEEKQVIHAYEQLAKAAEKYFKDGIAPVKSLQSLFDKFATWLTDIYKNVRGYFTDIKITPEVQALLDSFIVRDSVRTQNFGEIHTANRRYQIYRREGGQYIMIRKYHQGKWRNEWVNVTNLTKGEKANKYQTDLLGKGVRWANPIESMQRFLGDAYVAMEHEISLLRTLSLEELKEKAKGMQISIPKDFLDDQNSAADYLETYIRNEVMLGDPDVALYSQEEAQMLDVMMNDGKASLQGFLRSGMNAVGRWHIRTLDWLKKGNEFLGGTTGEKVYRKGQKVIDTQKKINGLFDPKLKSLLQKINQSPKARKFFFKYSRTGNHYITNWRLAVEGKIPEAVIPDEAKAILKEFHELVKETGLLFETGQYTHAGETHDIVVDENGELIKGLIYDPNYEYTDEKGNKKKGGKRPFKASPTGQVLERWARGELHDILSAQDNHWRKLLAEALAIMNPKTGMQLSKRTAQILEELDADAALINNPRMTFAAKRAAFERIRSYENFPDGIIDPSSKQFIQLLHADPYENTLHMISSTALRLGFISQFGQDNENLELLEQEWKAKTDPRKDHWKFEKIMRALSGMPIYQNHKVSPNIWMWNAGKLLDASILIMRSAGASLSGAANIFETLSLTSSLFGYTRVANAWLHLVKDNRNLAHLISDYGARTMIASKMYANPLNQVDKNYDQAKIIAELIYKLSAVEYINNWNEIVAATAGMKLAEDLKARVHVVGGPWRRFFSTDRTTLRALGYTDEQAERMMAGKGTDEEYASIARRAASYTQGTSAMPAERTMLSQSKQYKRWVQFDGYFQTRFNRFLNNWRNLIRAPNGKERWEAGQIVAKEIFGTTLAGVGTQYLIALITGGLSGFWQKDKEREEELGQFLFQSWIWTMFGGPAVSLYKTIDRGEKDALMILAGTSAMATTTIEAFNAITGQGKYEDKEVTRKLKEFLLARFPFGRTLYSYLTIQYYGSSEFELNNAKKSYYKWAKELPGTRTRTKVTDRERNDAYFHKYMIKAYDEIKKDGRDAAAFDLLLTAAGAEDLSDTQRVAASLRARKVLRGPEGGKLTMQEEEYMKVHLTETYWETLAEHDEILEYWAEQIHPTEE